MKIFLLWVFILGSFHSTVWGQGQVGGEPDEEAKHKLTAEQIDEFKKLDKLSKKLIDVVSDRWLNCRLEVVEIESFAELFEKLGGKNYKADKVAHCSTCEVKRNNRCLIKFQAHRVLRVMMKNKEFALYLKVRLNLPDSEVKNAVKFFQEQL